VVGREGERAGDRAVPGTATICRGCATPRVGRRGGCWVFGRPAGEEPPEIVAIAGDDLYYLSWLVRLEAEGEVLARRFQLGQLEVLEELIEDGWVPAAGSANAEPDHESGTNPFIASRGRAR